MWYFRFKNFIPSKTKDSYYFHDAGWKLIDALKSIALNLKPDVESAILKPENFKQAFKELFGFEQNLVAQKIQFVQ